MLDERVAAGVEHLALGGIAATGSSGREELLAGAARSLPGEVLMLVIRKAVFVALRSLRS
jgi:hypothetical protein